MDRKSPIQRYFTGKNIVITGSTGACGRILLEKILRSLVDIGTIFLIVRPKRDLTPKQRLQKFLSTPLFSLKPIEKSQFEKIIVIEGDISADSLNMSDTDRQLLIDKTHIIFHVAASVRFTASFRENFTSNVIGTENMLKFATKFKHLECFVHVSTAYSNCQLKTIDESLPLISTDVNMLVEKFKSMDDKPLEIEGVKYFDGRPNNYTFTKAMAEHVVNSYFSRIPVAIARPAVVACCAKEPIPGFIDSLDGPAGLALVAAIGILQVTDWNLNNRVECYPVDYLANSLIAIAYNSQKKTENIPVYNLVTTPLNNYPGDYELILRGRKFWMESPSIYTLRQPAIPQLFNRMSDTEYKMKRFIYHTMFAYFLDLMLWIVGRKRMMVRIVKRMHTSMDVMKYFSNRQWTFHCDNYKAMIDEMSEEDRAIFPIDISEVDIPEMFNESNKVGRRMILKEDDSNIPIAKLKFKIQGFIFMIVKYFVLYKILLLIVSVTPIGPFIEDVFSHAKYSMLDLIKH